MAEYGKLDYWDERYLRDPEPFDWYQRFDAFQDCITQHLDPNGKILNIGCGSSRLGEDMYFAGYQNIINIDTSAIVIKSMIEKNKDKGPSFKFIHMDARALDFEDGTINCVIDKATLDSILCGENSVANATKVLSEVYRVLAPGGIYVLITFGTPEYRHKYLNKSEFNWKIVQELVVPKPPIAGNDDKEYPNNHYVFICKKAA